MSELKLGLLSLSFVFFSMFFDGGTIKTYMPYNYLHGIYKYFIEKSDNAKERLDISKAYDYKQSNSAENLNVIFVIGESARSDHFHINGYSRETSPNLDKITDLISFKNSKSCSSFTRDSVPCLLSRATEDNIEISQLETSFISIFKKLGFNTAWLSNQYTYSSIDDPISTIYAEVNKLKLFKTDFHDLMGIKLYDEEIITHSLNELKPGKNLIILHSIGSHHDYEARYPESYGKFMPVCKKSIFFAKCTDQELVNSYDNTILYTDYVISEIIKKYSDKNTLFIYASDHGESLGEDGYYNHGNNKREEQINIPIFFWMSEKYKTNFPNEYMSIKKNSKKPISHNYIFHSILGCSGIESRAIDNKYNLCTSSEF